MPRHKYLLSLKTVLMLVFLGFGGTVLVSKPAQSLNTTVKNQIIPRILTLSSTESLIQRAAQKVSVRFRPPNLGAPKKTAGAGSRSNSCSASNESITPLVPKTPKDNQVGLTVAEYPTLFLYIPKFHQQPVKFNLKDASGKIVYRTLLPIQGKSGIVNISLPPTELSPLQVGQMYTWSLTIVCDPQDASADIKINQQVQRVMPSPQLLKQLQQSSPQKRPTLYANSGIWHETLITLAELRRSSPKDASLVAEWQELLKSAGLEGLAQAPLIDCCTLKP